jgi:hypothetical protein
MLISNSNRFYFTPRIGENSPLLFVKSDFFDTLQLQAGFIRELSMVLVRREKVQLAFIVLLGYILEMLLPALDYYSSSFSLAQEAATT